MTKITQYLKLLFSRNKLLTLAFIASLLTHILLLSKFAFTLPELNEGQQPIEIRLVNVQAMQKSATQALENTSQEPLVEQVSSISKSERLVTSVSSTRVEKPELPIDNIEAEVVSDKEKIQPFKPVINEAVTNPATLERLTERLTSEAHNETNEINKSSRITNFTKKPAPHAYQYVETEFEDHHGDDPSNVGITLIIFNLDKNRTYTLKRISHTPLVSNTLTESSEGIVTDKGLIPSFYSYQYGKDPNNSRSSRFVWSNDKLQMHSASADKTEDLMTGAQDSLSGMYQFMFSPPLDNAETTKTDGKKLMNDIYSVQGEEQILTKLGELNTLHLLKSGGDEETELWLGLDYQYLPVRIRKTEKNGNFIDQTITRIYTSLP